MVVLYGTVTFNFNFKFIKCETQTQFSEKLKYFKYLQSVGIRSKVIVIHGPL